MGIFEKIKKEFYKVLYKVTHSKKYHHNRKLWPDVKITRNKDHEIIELLYKGEKIPLLGIDRIKRGQGGPILLIASGPSINDIKFDKKLDIPIMGVNGAYSLNGVINFSFYVITDIYFPDHRPNIIKEIISDKNLILFTTVGVIIKIIKKHSIDFLKCSIFIIEDVYERTYLPKYNFHDLYISNKENLSFHFDKINNIGFSTDINEGLFPGKTVIYWALQIISYLGFEKVYILGMDMNNFEKPRFYENKNDKVHTQLDIDMDSIMLSLKQASYVLEQKLGVKVINLSPNSSVPETIFKKSEFKKYFS
ncbi:sugar glycosyltransferase [Pectobacterium cacticida]|uniref:Sugar glycosyltransferase n=1 Tax=Pectobacterium cacticida TaxID=69221 RepID=A0ABZ2GCS6_9GAMM|nr:sugar glycosyltransferase [Pectobacterium cacticida]UYX06616.1 sugar glycosyltransferase [Pectobacterium cacticida]